MSNHDHPCRYCGRDMRQDGSHHHESVCPERPSNKDPHKGPRGIVHGSYFGLLLWIIIILALMDIFG